jgi:recombination associated protein RdgC
MFRNVRFYRFIGEWPASEAELSDSLATASFTPCGPLTEQTAGWEPPIESPAGLYCRRVAGADLLQLRAQSRLLPAAAINEALETRIEQYLARTGEAPGARERRKLRLETRDNLLPKALLKSQRTRAFCLLPERVLAIDAAAPSRVESFLETLRAPLGKFEARPLEFDRPVGELLTRVFLGEALDGIVVGRECRMQDPAESRSTVRWADMDLADPGIRRHVRDGMRLTHLGIGFDNLLSCVLDEDGGLGKLRLTGVDADASAEGDDPLARFDAECVLLTGTLRRLLTLLERTLGARAPAH